MTEVPKPLAEIAEKSAAKYPDEIDRAVEEAERKIRKLPNFSSLFDWFVNKTVRDLIHQARHVNNVAIKRDAGYFENEPRVSNKSESVVEAYRSAYDYCIDKRSLGSLLGKELMDIARNEQALADGHMFNHDLCLELAGLVKPEQSVREAVSEKRLKLIFQKLRKGKKKAG